MPRPSKISRLPEVRDFLAAKRADGLTIDELLEAVREAFPSADVSRSGIGRHVQGLDKLAEKLNRSRVIAEALVRRLGDAPEGRQARLNIELMHGIVTDLALATADAETESGEAHPVTFDPAQVHFLAKALDHLTRAQRTDQAATLQLRAELAKEMNAKVDRAAREVATIAHEKGLSSDTVAEIQAKIAGIRTASASEALPAAEGWRGGSAAGTT